MFAVLGKTIKGLFYLAMLLVALGIFAGMSRLSRNGSTLRVPSVDVQTRCDSYNGTYKCETQMN